MLGATFRFGRPTCFVTAGLDLLFLARIRPSQLVLVSKKLSLSFLSFRRVVRRGADGSRASSGRVIQRRREYGQ